MKAWQNRHSMMLLNGDHSGILWHSMFNGFSGYTVCLSYCQKPTGWIDRMCHLNATFIEDECYSGWRQIFLIIFFFSRWVYFEVERGGTCFPFCCHCCSFIQMQWLEQKTVQSFPPNRESPAEIKCCFIQSVWKKTLNFSHHLSHHLLLSSRKGLQSIYRHIQLLAVLHGPY